MGIASNDNDSDQTFGDRVAARVDDVRDRAAGALSAEDSPAFRELTRVRGRLDDVETALAEQIRALGREQGELVEELHAESKRTTVPRKMFWFLLGGAAAAIGTWLADPDRGKARRTQLADQVTSQARDLGEQARTQATQVVNEARGSFIEAGKDAMGEDVPDDPAVLRQRIKSEVFGRRDDVADVVVTVGAPGEVTLKGTVSSTSVEQELVEAVGEVNGVTRVDSDLAVAATT